MRRPALIMLFWLCLMASPAAAEPPAVVVHVANLRDFPMVVEALGTARANESIEIRPEIAKTITAIRFEGGQRVEAGEVLIELEDSAARADVAVARAALLDTKGQYRRARKLFETRAVSASELEQREARRDADRAALDAAEARLAETLVRAPFAGRLGLRNVSLGRLVGPGDVITTLDDTDIIKLDFDVPERALSQVAVGQVVIARSVAWPDVLFEGKVLSIDTRLDPISRSVVVRALVDNAEGLLRPGMFLAVELRREDVRSLMIPEQAIMPEQSRQFVLVVGEGDVVARREIVSGRRRPGEIEVLSGLEPGDRVIVEGTQKARPGQPVRPVPAERGVVGVVP